MEAVWDQLNRLWEVQKETWCKTLQVYVRKLQDNLLKRFDIVISANRGRSKYLETITSSVCRSI